MRKGESLQLIRLQTVKKFRKLRRRETLQERIRENNNNNYYYYNASTLLNTEHEAASCIMSIQDIRK